MQMFMAEDAILDSELTVLQALRSLRYPPCYFYAQSATRTAALGSRHVVNRVETLEAAYTEHLD